MTLAAVKMRFNFKTRAIKDDTGATIGRSKKQPSVDCDLPVPTADTVADFLRNVEAAECKLVMSAVADIVYAAAREQFDEIIEAFGDDESKSVAADMLDLNRLDFSYIANLPPSTRSSSVPSEDDFKDFFEDYLAVMVQATGKEEARIMKHVELFKKPTKAKASKEVLELLISQLDIYMANTANLEDHANCANRILTKYQRWVAEPEKTVDLDLL